MNNNGNNFLSLLACIGLFNALVVIAQINFNNSIKKEVTDLSIAVKSYSDRFVARDHDHVIVVSPKELVFKVRGQPSLRLQLKQSKKHLYLRAKPN